MYDRRAFGRARRRRRQRRLQQFRRLSIEDLFESFFGNAGARGARQRVQRGQDLRYDMHLTLEEAVFGATKEISLTKHASCARCTGSGMEPGSQRTKCNRCEGSGEIRRMLQSIFGQFVNVTLCDRCNGECQIISDPCAECQGRGVVRAKPTVSVDVPAGADEGIQLRLNGQGEPAPRGGVAGHLYVVLHVQPHRSSSARATICCLRCPSTWPRRRWATIRRPDARRQRSPKSPLHPERPRHPRPRRGCPFLRESTAR
jgi:DnaJ-class molecular chaperone